MDKFLKLIATLLIISVLGYAIYGAYHAITAGNYLTNAPGFNLALYAIGYIVLFFFGLRTLGKIWDRNTTFLCMAFVIMAAAGEGCTYAKSNQKVLISEDCGMNWKEITAGQSVPTKGMSTCYMKVVIPNYPMQGDSKFLGNFKDKVRAWTHIDYDYSIINGLKFINQARYLGAANKDADDNAALNDAAFEQAENSIIDKRIKEVAKGIFPDEDIIDLDMSDLEDKLFAASNKMLEEFGVKLNFITLTFDLDDQTRQAIDVATAMKIYNVRGLGEIGQKVITARAGAAKIVVEARKEDEVTVQK